MAMMTMMIIMTTTTAIKISVINCVRRDDDGGSGSFSDKIFSSVLTSAIY